MSAKSIALLLLAALLAGCAATPPGVPSIPVSEPRGNAWPLPAAETRAERVVLLTIHGMSPAAYGVAPTLPTVARLASAGVAVDRMIPVFPPAPYPAHTALVTGRRPDQHGVPADRQIGKRGVRSERYDHASVVLGPSLWQAATAAGVPVAALDWPATGGAAIADLLPDTGAAAPAGGWLAALEQRAGPRVATLAAEAGAADPAAGIPGAARDRVLGQVACSLLTGQASPRLLLLRLSQTEVALGLGPPDSTPVRQAFAGADAEVNRLLDCLARAGRLASTAVIVAGDHGTVPAHTAVRANAILAEVGLQVVIRGAISSWSALARSNGGSAFVYAIDGDAALLARRALLASAEQTGAFRVLSAEEMSRRGGDPEAWFGLEAAPGFVFDDGAAGFAIIPAPPTGAGGYAPEMPAMAAGLVAWGAGLRGPLRVPELRQTDVAPTVARLLGVDLGETEGRVLVGLLTGDGSIWRGEVIVPDVPSGAAQPARPVR